MPRYQVLAVFSILSLLPLPTLAQAPVELTPQESDLWEHMAGYREVIHSDKVTPFEAFDAHIELEVIVLPNGRVNEAHAVRGPKEFYARAEEIEFARTFRPFLHNGVPVTAKIEDFVSVAPPEAWLPKPVPFPAAIDLATVSMSLSRTGCFGTCPAYKVSIAANGSVAFDGGSDVLIPGHHSAQISAIAAKDLLNAFRKADFLSAQAAYVASVTDCPTYRLTLVMNGTSKTVEDYMGTEVGLPDAIKDLEREIDDVADTERWIKGNAETYRSLKAERWDFSSSKPDSIALYRSAVNRGNEQLVDAFIAAKAPVDIADPNVRDGGAPICVASAKGDFSLVERMLGVQKNIRKDVLQPCLGAAARGGNTEIVDLWLGRGANPALPAETNPRLQEPSVMADGILSGKPEVVTRLLDYPVDLHEKVYGNTPLLSWALRSRDSAETDEILKLLVKAGASVDERGNMGQTPLYDANLHPEAMKTLLALGATIDARDENGNTPLINSAFNAEAVNVLLNAGADPTLANKRGETAVQIAQRMSCAPCARTLEEAVARRQASATR